MFPDLVTQVYSQVSVGVYHTHLQYRYLGRSGKDQETLNVLTLYGEVSPPSPHLFFLHSAEDDCADQELAFSKSFSDVLSVLQVCIHSSEVVFIARVPGIRSGFI